MRQAREHESRGSATVKLKVLLAGALLMTAGPTRASAPLEIRVTPTVSFAPANLAVRTTIESDSENRAIVVIADSDAMYRSSRIPLDGKNSPRVNIIQFRSLPGGQYQVRAVLVGANGRAIAYAETDANVIDGGVR